MTLTVIVFALAGAVLGFVADRVAARMRRRRRPDEADSVIATATPTPDVPLDLRADQAAVPRRGVDWRTATMVVVGAVAFAALAARWTEPRDLAFVGAWFAALTILMATDLDQRILPDVITLPLIPIALVAVVAGADPLLHGKDFGLGSALIAAIAAPIVLAGTSLVLGGGIGFGDLKLAVSLGLVSGISRLFVGFLLASAASAVVLIALLASRRLSRKQPIPFGPVLIGAGFVAALLGG